jgi:hypothetical protein
VRAQSWARTPPLGIAGGSARCLEPHRAADSADTHALIAQELGDSSVAPGESGDRHVPAGALDGRLSGRVGVLGFSRGRGRLRGFGGCARVARESTRPHSVSTADNVRGRKTHFGKRFSGAGGGTRTRTPLRGTPAFKAGASHPFRHPGETSLRSALLATSRAGAGSGRSAQARGTAASRRTTRRRLRRTGCTSRGRRCRCLRPRPRRRARTCLRDGSAAP